MFSCFAWAQNAFQSLSFFFFFFLAFGLKRLNFLIVNSIFMYCLWIYKYYFYHFFIKNRSHNIIYIFKNYFITICFDFQFQFSNQNNSKFIPYLKYFLSAFYSIHVNLLNSTPSYFTPFKLQDSPYLTWLALPTTHIFRFFSPTWNYFPSLPLAKICFQIWSLFLFLRLGIQLRFTASTPVPLFTASQICHHQCEAKVKRSQIGI